MQFDLFEDGGGAAVMASPPAPPVAIEDLSLAVAAAVAAGTALCYDLDCETFRAFAERRGVLYQFARPGARAWAYLRDLTLSERDWLSDEAVRYAQEHEGKRHRYSDDQMRSHWGVVEIQRRKIQTCWEGFCKEMR